MSQLLPAERFPRLSWVRLYSFMFGQHPRLPELALGAAETEALEAAMALGEVDFPFPASGLGN